MNKNDEIILPEIYEFLTKLHFLNLLNLIILIYKKKFYIRVKYLI